MPDRDIVSREKFHALAKGEARPEVALRGSFATTIKAADDGSRRMTFTISTASIDRYGDTIAVDGWQLEAYRANPVVLWAHDQSSLPLGRATRVEVDGAALVAEAEFTPAGVARFNDAVYDMLKGGFLNATSVGFLPLEWKFADDPGRRYGVDFTKQELLEFSVVPVPANAEALVQARAAGIDAGPLVDWARRIVARDPAGDPPAFTPCDGCDTPDECGAAGACQQQNKAKGLITVRLADWRRVQQRQAARKFLAAL